MLGRNVLLMRDLLMKVPIRLRKIGLLKGGRSYNFTPNNDVLTHYTPTLRNHENFSYGGGKQQGPRLMQNFQ